MSLLLPDNVANVTVCGALLTPGLVLGGSSDRILETSDFHISFSVKGQCNVFMCTYAMFRQNGVSEINS